MATIGGVIVAAPSDRASSARVSDAAAATAPQGHHIIVAAIPQNVRRLALSSRRRLVQIQCSEYRLFVKR